MRFSPGMVAIGLGLGTSALAAPAKPVFEDHPLPETVSQVSTASTRRYAKSFIQDCFDDKAANQYARDQACFGMGDAGTVSIADRLPTLEVTRRIGSMFELYRAPDPRGYELPVYADLRALGTRARATAEEQATLDRLLTTRAHDRLELYDLLADMQWLVARITQRLYAQETARWLDQVGQWVTQWGDPAVCAAYSVRLERDRELSRAINQIVRMMDQLDREEAR